MIQHADGALAEVPFPACEDFFGQNPDELISFLFCDNKLSTFYQSDWAQAIVDGIELAKSEDSRKYIPRLRQLTYRRISTRNRKNPDVFFVRISKWL